MSYARLIASWTAHAISILLMACLIHFGTSMRFVVSHDATPQTVQQKRDVDPTAV